MNPPENAACGSCGHSLSDHYEDTRAWNVGCHLCDCRTPLDSGKTPPDSAATQIDEIVRASRLRTAYYDGHQDGALSVLAPALGVEPQEGQPTHQLMGRRFRITIEWLDPVSDDHLEVARRMAERAQHRAQERL